MWFRGKHGRVSLGVWTMRAEYWRWNQYKIFRQTHMDRLLEAEDIVWLYRGMICHTVRDYCWQVCHMFAEYTTITHTHFFMGPKKTISDKKMAIYIYHVVHPIRQPSPISPKIGGINPPKLGFPHWTKPFLGIDCRTLGFAEGHPKIGRSYDIKQRKWWTLFLVFYADKHVCISIFLSFFIHIYIYWLCICSYI